MAYTPPSSPQSLGGVIDDGIRLFAAAFGRCWLLAIIPGLVLATYEVLYPMPMPTPGAIHRLAQFWKHAGSYFGAPRMITMDALNLVLTLVFQGAVIVRQIAIARLDETCTFGHAIAASVRRLPGMLLATILSLLAVLGGLILVGIIGAVLSGIVPGLHAALRSHLPIEILIALALVVAGLQLTVRFQLWTVALFIERASATAALASSWRLTRGHWWRAAAILSVAVIMIIVLAACFALVGGAIAAVTGFGSTARTAIIYLASLGSNAIYYPLGAAIWLAMYHDFKLRREGGDLEQRAGALSGTG